MTSRELVVPRVVATGTASIATATTVNVDFGTPDDVWVKPSASGFKPGDRLVAVITASTAGTTDSTSFSVQDAADNGSGAIGTPGTAETTTLPAAATGNQYVVVGIRLRPGKPWIRVRATRGAGTTDTLVIRAVLLAIPHNL